MSASPDDMSSMMDSGLSDQDLQQLVSQLGGISATPEKNQALEQQIKMAQMLRSGAQMPQGHMAGQVYVGPNALQSLSAAGNQAMALNSVNEAVQGMQNNAGDQQAARTAYMKMLAQALRQKQMQQPPSQSMNDAATGVDLNDIAGNAA
jgi:hypothetical protein